MHESGATLDIELPDGTVVRATPVRQRDPHDTWRDFGLYCDPSWAPTWPAELIDWPDFGLPTDPTQAAAQITAAYHRAQSGQHVEIGCIGALGRTGTVLACMATLTGLTPAAAITWVRTTYDPRAIETPQQESWVTWFVAREQGTGSRE